MHGKKNKFHSIQTFCKKFKTFYFYLFLYFCHIFSDVNLKNLQKKWCFAHQSSHLKFFRIINFAPMNGCDAVMMDKNMNDDSRHFRGIKISKLLKKIHRKESKIKFQIKLNI